VHVQALGHVVLKVRDLERSEIFYSDILGMRVVSRISDPPMTFFRTAVSDQHHDFALMELSPHAPTASSSGQDVIGLAHVAFKIGRSAEEFRHARSVLDAAGTRCLYEADRAFAKSVHVLDPDGNEVELYIETVGHSKA
jgi:catechol 2,3-dioxygenase-like lactoylglutathione lyase family enzyme